jgi:Zn-dependent protease with chaperone function
MFGNIIYYIVALLIYSTYQPVHDPDLSIIQSAALLIFFFLIYGFVTRWLFRKIESQISHYPFRRIDHQFHSALTQQSIFAIILYAVDIYFLNTPAIANRLAVFQKLPTLEAFCFLLLFIAYLIVLWNYAFDPYLKIYKTEMSKNEYIISNISFSVPILLPWFIFSMTTDLVQFLPFEGPRRFLSSAGGQVLYFICFLLIVAIIGPAFIQKFWQCRPLTHTGIRHRIETMCRKARMGFKDILIWPLFGGKMISAGVMGLIQRFRYILVTPALIDLLEPGEIDAVIAHEIGHIKQKHLLFYLCFFVGYIIISFALTDLIVYLLIYIGAAFGFIAQSAETDSFLISLCFSFSTIFIFVLYFRYIFGFFMRNFERQADIFAYIAIGSPLPLISTFEKISLSSGQSPDKPNWHHFSIHERISYLIRCASDRRWIDRHNAKIKKGFLIYLIAIMLLGWIGLTLHHGETRETMQANLLKKIISEKIKNDPANANLHQIMGDLHSSEKKYDEAVNCYKRALQINPDQVNALNNLAWLYATSDDPLYRQPQQSLELALRAASISPEPHILDTLAEAYYVNGEIENAIKTSEKSLLSASHNNSYYLEQMKKFQKAARSSQGHE